MVIAKRFPFSFGLLWLRFQPFSWVSTLERWAGVGIFTSGMLIRIGAAYYDMAPLDRLSFIVTLWGVFLMVGGWHVIRWAGPAILFLLFMFPLPSILEHSLLWNLQRLATVSSTFTLQTMGVPAYRQGNRIIIDEMELGVVDACSGLRMLTIFCALAVAMVFLVDRPWWDKFAILLSAIPIALIVNIVRITFTALLYMWLGEDNEFVQKIVHDWAGFLMMPLALGLLWLELQILSKLTVPEETAQVWPMGNSARGVIPVR